MEDAESTPLLGAQAQRGESSSLYLAANNGAANVGSRRNILVSAFVPEWVSFDPRRVLRAYNFRSLVAIKPMETFLQEREDRPEGQRLAERLGVIDLLGYGVGSTVGAGIYSLIGVAAGIAGKLACNLYRVYFCVARPLTVS